MRPTTSIEIDFPISAILKLKGCFQIIFVDQGEKHIHSYEQFIKMRNYKKMTIQEADTSSENVGDSSGSSPPVFNGTYGDAKNP
jgi:hypothetical protein